MSHYHLLDRPDVLQFAFYPVKQWSDCPDYASDFFVTVEDNIRVACRFYVADPEYPSVLFFHGNGEVASDYDDIAPYFFSQSNVNLIVAEFRGYGASEGKPTFTGILADSHKIYQEVSREISRRGCRNDIWVMGRSIGSVSALELAKNYPGDIRGLILESGFPSAASLARRLMLPVPEADLRLIDDECLQKIRGITMPALIIHGDNDTLVPIDNAYTMEKELGSAEKRLFVVCGADHNSVLVDDPAGYFQAIKEFIHH